MPIVSIRLAHWSVAIFAARKAAGVYALSVPCTLSYAFD